MDRASVWEDKKFRRWPVVMVAQHYECIYATALYTLNGLKC